MIDNIIGDSLGIEQRESTSLRGDVSSFVIKTTQLCERYSLAEPLYLLCAVKSFISAGNENIKDTRGARGAFAVCFMHIFAKPRSFETIGLCAESG